jgi:hypothetical protein
MENAAITHADVHSDAWMANAPSEHIKLDDVIMLNDIAPSVTYANP